MPDNVDVDPQVLLDLANQHDTVADNTRQWAQPPTDWLNQFPDTYGKIAHPVHEALQRYYDARQRAGEALADGHNRTADALRTSAARYHQADEHGGSQLRNAGNLFGGQPGHHGAGPAGLTGPMGPGGPGGGPSRGPGGGPGNHAAGPGGTSPGGPGAGNQGGAPGYQTPGGNGVIPPGFTGSGTVPNSGFGMVPPVMAGDFGGGPGGGPGGGLGGGPGGRPGGGPDGGPGSTPPLGLPGPDYLTPFGEAVASAKQREDDSAHVVNGAADDDLVIAQTLLSAVLAAVEESVAGTAWAVSVMRGPVGAGVFVTSNEGRGWLPAAIFLPREVSTPWLWDEVLDIDGEGGASPWEGVADPARVLAEFGLAWGPRAGAELSAVASSGPIDASLRARFSDVPMQGLVGPSYDLDLRVFTPDTADRLGLTGSASSLEHVAAVSDSAVRSRCIELAAEAHAQVVRAVPATPDVAAARRLREAIVTAIQSGRNVPRTLWDDLRDADDLLAAALLTRRVDVGRVDVGALRVDDEAGSLRDLVFERRCNELVLMLAAEDSMRQNLRDAIYAHAQIVEHPQFVPAPVAVSAPEPERVARPAATGGAVSASMVTAGPPSGASVAPPTGAIPPQVKLPPNTAVPESAPETS